MARREAAEDLSSRVLARLRPPKAGAGAMDTAAWTWLHVKLCRVLSLLQLGRCDEAKSGTTTLGELLDELEQRHVTEERAEGGDSAGFAAAAGHPGNCAFAWIRF